MLQNQKIEILSYELTSIKKIDDRRVCIHKDTKSRSPKYKILAEEKPFLFFEILGGDEFEIISNNWAFEYTYEDYIEQYDIEFDQADADKWNIEEKSIENANESGHWYVTGTCIIQGPNNIELEFEFDYCDGLLDRIIGTPYNENEHGNHGILF